MIVGTLADPNATPDPKAPAIFKFDLMPQNGFTTRTVMGTVDSGSSTTIMDSDLTESDDYWMGRTVTWGGGDRIGDDPTTMGPGSG